MRRAGFLLTADMPAALQRSKLVPGSLVNCIVTKVDKKKKVISVSANEKESSAQESDGFTLNNLSPGMLVTAKVKTILPDGLMVTCLTYFTVRCSFRTAWLRTTLYRFLFDHPVHTHCKWSSAPAIGSSISRCARTVAEAAPTTSFRAGLSHAYPDDIIISEGTTQHLLNT